MKRCRDVKRPDESNRMRPLVFDGLAGRNAR
jgi:hypothetical protein